MKGISSMYSRVLIALFSTTLLCILSVSHQSYRILRHGLKKGPDFRKLPKSRNGPKEPPPIQNKKQKTHTHTHTHTHTKHSLFEVLLTIPNLHLS